MHYQRMAFPIQEEELGDCGNTRGKPNIVTHSHSRGRRRGEAYQPQPGRGSKLGRPDRPRDNVPHSQEYEGQPDRTRSDAQHNHGGGREMDHSRLGGSEGDSLLQPTRGQTNRRNGLYTSAPPFHPRHTQQQRSQQPQGTLRTQPQSQSNKDRINTLFQPGLFRLTESPLLNDEEWMTFCNKLDELTRTIAQLCDKDRPHNRQDNNRNGQRGYRQQEASQPERRPNRLNGRERRIREMANIQKLYRKNPKQAMKQIKQEPPPLRCQIPCQTVQDYFEQLGRPTPNFDNPGLSPFGSWPTSRR